MLTCRKFKLLGVVLYFIDALILFGIDFSSEYPSYGVTLLTLIELFIFEVLMIYFYCRIIKNKNENENYK